LNSDPTKPQLTANGAVIGSPVYMSPEQILGKKTVDARSDVWQLGVILYELVSGECPFDGKTMAEIMIAIGTQPAKPLRQVRPDAPPELEAIIARCLEKDAARRLPDVAALAEGLLPLATTRRAQVSVEHIVTLIRGAQAAAQLPPMRAQFQSGPMLLMDRVSGVPGGPPNAGVRTPAPPGPAPAERSNPYAQTQVSQEPSGSGARAVAAPNQTAPAANASPSSTKALLVTISVVVLLLGLLAAYRIMTRDAEPGGSPRLTDPAPKPVPAAPAKKP
jgi:serine/threonine-protein kinase